MFDIKFVQSSSNFAQFSNIKKQTNIQNLKSLTQNTKNQGNYQFSRRFGKYSFSNLKPTGSLSSVVRVSKGKKMGQNLTTKVAKSGPSTISEASFINLLASVLISSAFSDSSVSFLAFLRSSSAFLLRPKIRIKRCHDSEF